jgi:uncharacterized protein (TIGR02145 family)
MKLKAFFEIKSLLYFVLALSVASFADAECERIYHKFIKTLSKQKTKTCRVSGVDDDRTDIMGFFFHFGLQGTEYPAVLIYGSDYDPMLYSGDDYYVKHAKCIKNDRYRILYTVMTPEQIAAKLLSFKKCGDDFNHPANEGPHTTSSEDEKKNVGDENEQRTRAVLNLLEQQTQQANQKTSDKTSNDCSAYPRPKNCIKDIDRILDGVAGLDTKGKDELSKRRKEKDPSESSGGGIGDGLAGILSGGGGGIAASQKGTMKDTEIMKDSRDGQTYKTVKIGKQVWMAENLNYETENSYCYDNDLANCQKYGRLYTWEAALNACPEGWRLPTNADFETLFANVRGIETAGKMLKSRTGWEDYEGKSGNGIDKYGFNVLPAGIRNNDGSFNYAGRSANFWSATEYKMYGAAYLLDLSYPYEDAPLLSNFKDRALSVRCLKD